MWGAVPPRVAIRRGDYGKTSQHQLAPRLLNPHVATTSQASLLLTLEEIGWLDCESPSWAPPLRALRVGRHGGAESAESFFGRHGGAERAELFLRATEAESTELFLGRHGSTESTE